MIPLGDAQNMMCPLNKDSWSCCGADCMMWRWAQPFAGQRVWLCEKQQALVEPERPAGLPKSWFFVPYDEAEGEPAQWVEPEVEAYDRRRGYCGLAGPVAHT